jgi:hypothetical protein
VKGKPHEEKQKTPLEELADSFIGKTVRLPNTIRVRIVGYDAKYFLWNRGGFTGSSDLADLPRCEVVQ